MFQQKFFSYGLTRIFADDLFFIRDNPCKSVANSFNNFFFAEA